MLFEAIRQATFFLSFEELESKERPPKSIWLDGEKLNAHFDRVKRDRDRKYGGGSDIEDPVDNVLAAEMLAAAG